jgi:hypothetical protein
MSRRHKSNQSIGEEEISEGDIIEERPVPRRSKSRRKVEEDEEAAKDKIKARLKEKITDWLDNDDKIKAMNNKMKGYKKAKKEQEGAIIKMITALGLEDNKINVLGEGGDLRSRVYRYKSVTKGAIKDDIIKSALMEAIQNEKKVDQLVKKIESKRPINERFYLKRTKGSNNDN